MILAIMAEAGKPLSIDDFTGLFGRSVMLGSEWRLMPGNHSNLVS